MVGAAGLATALVVACGAQDSTLDDDDSGSGAESPNGSGGSGGSGGALLAGGFAAVGGGGLQGPTCKVPPDQDDAVIGTCDETAPPDAFEPAVQWEWTAPPPSGANALYTGSFVTPLVGNFTDDNGDGEIDLCDTPDVIVTVVDDMQFGGTLTLTASAILYMLDGASGTEIMAFPGLVDGFVYPAFGDIDNDGLPEVVTANQNGQIVAYEHDGTLKWTGPVGGYRASFASAQCTAVGIYDIDADGSPEIIMGYEVFDNQGNRLWGVPGNAAEYEGQYWCVTPTAADLDGDGKLEVLFGHQTYDDDGTLLWTLPGQMPGHPHVANLDGDPDPEVFITNPNGIWVLEHDGTPKFGPLRPTDPNPAPNCWGKPAVVHDFDGDGDADIAAATCSDYTVYDVTDSGVAIRWSQPVQDASGLATATAFDFLGDAVAEAIYADETQIYVFDGVNGGVNLTAPRSSGTLIEYPVVADIDNDASAEIVYVSNYAANPGPTVSVTRDAMDRWIPARRIWNQYGYHVTNVREDGTIPAVMKKSWLNLNTFRTNAQINEQGDCIPATPE